MKKRELIKSILVAVIVPLLFYAALEFTQRVRWYHKSGGNAAWLLYGLVERPADFDEQIAYIAARKKAAEGRYANGLQDIQIWTKKYPGGMLKHNPEAPQNKGQVNSLGFRSYEFNPEKSPGTYRIITTGASTTAGYENDIDHTYPALLQKMLNANAPDGMSFEVINAGMGDQGVPYVNNLLKNELLGYKPDMVTFYLTFNHLAKWRGSISVPEDLRNRIYQFKQWLWSKSLLFLTLREKLGMLSSGGRVSLGDIYIPASDPKAIAAGFFGSPMVFDAYRSGLEDFVRTCKENGIVPVLITEACICKGDTYLLLGTGMEPVYSRMYSIEKEVADENGAVFIDAAARMCALPDRDIYFTDALHLTGKGNRRLAEIIYAEIVDTIKRGVR